MTGTTTPTAQSTLAELIRVRPALVGLFERVGLDFCCHGDRSLAQACQASGLSVDDVVAAMEADEATMAEPDSSWVDLGPSELADHIEAVHHRWLHAELPEVQRLSAKVLSVHGERHPELERVRALVDQLSADLEQHMAKEERVLFPAIRTLAGGSSGFPFGTVANPIAVMTAEHETAGSILRELNEVTSGYTVPADGCDSFRLLYQRLRTVQDDTHLHVFKENSVLFPAAVELEVSNNAAVQGG
jgi:regulator of cell morphogenesis and NO signaling